MNWLSGFFGFFGTNECGKDAAITTVCAFFAFLMWRFLGWLASKM